MLLGPNVQLYPGAPLFYQLLESTETTTRLCLCHPACGPLACPCLPAAQLHAPRPAKQCPLACFLPCHSGPPCGSSREGGRSWAGGKEPKAGWQGTACSQQWHSSGMRVERSARWPRGCSERSMSTGVVHAVLPAERATCMLPLLQHAKPITIGNDCWLGGGCIVMPGALPRRLFGAASLQHLLCSPQLLHAVGMHQQASFHCPAPCGCIIHAAGRKTDVIYWYFCTRPHAPMRSLKQLLLLPRRHHNRRGLHRGGRRSSDQGRAAIHRSGRQPGASDQAAAARRGAGGGRGGRPPAAKGGAHRLTSSGAAKLLGCCA